MKKKGIVLFCVGLMILIFTACEQQKDAASTSDDIQNKTVLEENNSLEEASEIIDSTVFVNDAGIKNESSLLPMKNGFVTAQILSGNNGDIHYSYYLPENYNDNKNYPMVVVMPGYDKMWFGEDSSGTNLDWEGVLSWTELDEDIIVVSAQLTDWGENSARQAVQLTEYFLENFPVDPNRVYAAGYSAGGETMSQAVAMRPDLFAAYLHGASQWDGTYEMIAKNRVAVYIFMAENDEYYGSQKARDAYDNLHDAYENAGLSDSQIDEVLKLEIPDNEYFNSRGIYNYHGGGSILFEDESILNWILLQEK